MDATRIVIIVLLVVMQAVFGAPQFLLGTEDYWLRALSYSFFHASWWHLAINAIATWSIFAPSRKCNWLHFVIGCIISVLVYPLSLRPVIGFSNVLYAVLGLRTPSLKSKWWRQPSVIVFLVVTVALVFVPQFSATTHIAAFLLGMASAGTKRGWLKITQDARRYY